MLTSHTIAPLKLAVASEDSNTMAVIDAASIARQMAAL